MKKIIEINSPEDCPFSNVWKDYITHEISHVDCCWNGDKRNDDDRRCMLPNSCPLPDSGAV